MDAPPPAQGKQTKRTLAAGLELKQTSDLFLLKIIADSGNA